MEQAVLNDNLIAIKAGYITVYHYRETTREYLAPSEEYLAVGLGIPRFSTIEKPGEGKAGFAICRTVALDAWEYVPDHRGETVYDINTKQKREITELGNYPADVTPLAPSTPYDKWDGSQWVTDQAALIAVAEAKKTQLLNEAKNTISLWQTELQLGIISDDDKARLVAWLQYIKLLQAVDTATAPNINWPQQPQ